MTELLHKQKTFFGRRRGKGMSKAKQDLLEKHLHEFVITLPKENKKIDFESLFNFTPSKYIFEIGYGTGEHLVQMALKNSDVAFIGTEVFVNGNASILKQILEYKLNNIKIFPDDVNLLFPYIPDNIFSSIFILYPDPWPKNRNENRRMINLKNLELFAKLLKKTGNLIVVSDHPVYVVWSLFVFQQQKFFKWDAISSKDFKDPPPSWETTHYEQKAIKENRIPIYLNFTKI